MPKLPGLHLLAKNTCISNGPDLGDANIRNHPALPSDNLKPAGTVPHSSPRSAARLPPPSLVQEVTAGQTWGCFSGSGRVRGGLGGPGAWLMEGSDTPVEREAWAEARTCPSPDPLWLRARGLRGGQRGLRTTDSLPGTSHIAAPRRTPVGKAELSHGRGVDKRGWSLCG